jgi:hypothetical protein
VLSGATASGAGAPPWTTVNLVVDPGFADASKWTLTGSGIGTSAVTGGVLQVTSTSNVYFALPATSIAPLEPGVYTVTYTVLTYVSGTIATIFSTSSALSGGTAGPARTGDGTYVETLTLPAGGYIGLAGQGAAVVNSLQIDNMTIARAS